MIEISSQEYEHINLQVENYRQIAANSYKQLETIRSYLEELGKSSDEIVAKIKELLGMPND